MIYPSRLSTWSAISIAPSRRPRPSSDSGGLERRN
jgi:hypothetical protein